MNRPAITARLAADCASLHIEQLPSAVVALARQCLLDWFGVTMLGSREPLVDILIAEANDRGAGGNTPVPGRNEKLGLLDAALVNGAAAHALDYDDGNRAGGHLTAPVASALLTLTHALDASGSDLITAFLAGYELSARIGNLIQPDHYARGFHPTATLGTFGAAAACSRLLNLDAAQTQIALGIAASMAAGVVGNFGTMCKPLHVGRAAMNGLQAARLAQRGFSAREAILEHANGFVVSHSGDFHGEAALATPAHGFHISANVFKFHAACAGTHSTIDAISALRDEHALRPEQIRRVVVRMNPRLDRVCNIAAPRTGLEMKFSLRMMAALALAGIDTSAPAVFTDALASDATLIALRDRIVVEASDQIAVMATAIDIDLNDGHRLHAACLGDVPEADICAQAARVANKFDRLATPIVGSARSGCLREKIENLSAQSRARELLDLAVPT